MPSAKAKSDKTAVTPVSVLILTKNEEQDLPGCLRSVNLSDDVHVFDSFSTDATCNIAREFGAKVSQRKFDGYASQRNAALSELEFRYEWLLIVDADERIPEVLWQEIKNFIDTAPARVSAARIRRRDFFQGQWLKHAQISPWYIRLVRHRHARYEREINEVMKVDGEIADLAEPFDHFPFSKGIRHWVDKHNVYSTMEAKVVFEGRRARPDFSITTALFGRDFNERREHQKALFYRLPMRPMIKWLYMMFVRGAIWDGKAGIAYSNLQCMYEYMIVLKTRELEHQAKHGPKSSV